MGILSAPIRTHVSVRYLSGQRFKGFAVDLRRAAPHAGFGETSYRQIDRTSGYYHRKGFDPKRDRLSKEKESNTSEYQQRKLKEEQDVRKAQEFRLSGKFRKQKDGEARGDADVKDGDENGDEWREYSRRTPAISVHDALNWISLAKHRMSKPNRGVMSMVLRVLQPQKKLAAMWEVFVLARKHKVKMPSASYTLLIKCLRSRSQFDEGMAVYARMRREQVHPSMSVINYIASVCAIDRRGRDMDYLAADVQDRELSLTPETLASFIYAYGRIGYRDEVVKYYEQLFDIGIERSWDQRVIHQVIGGFGYVKDESMVKSLTEEVLKGHRKLKDQQVRLALARARAELGDHEGVKRHHASFETKKPIESELVLFGLMDCYSRLGDVASVARLYESYVRNLPSTSLPRLNVRQTVAKAFANLGLVDGVKSIVFSEEQRPSRTLFHHLMRAHGINGELEEADKVLKTMEHYGIPPDSETQAWLLFAASRSGADKYVSETKRRYVALEKDAAYQLRPLAFQSMVDMFLRAGAEERVAEVVRKMIQHRLRPNFEMYESIVSHFAQKDDILGCCKVFAQFSAFYEVDEEMLDRIFLREVALHGTKTPAFTAMEAYRALAETTPRKLIPRDPLGRQNPSHGILEYAEDYDDLDHEMNPAIMKSSIPVIDLNEVISDVIEDSRRRPQADA